MRPGGKSLFTQLITQLKNVTFMSGVEQDLHMSMENYGGMISTGENS
jgi:hypothetical protein